LLLDRFPEAHALILDMDGVLWRDDQAIGDLNDIIHRIDVLRLKYILSTNNSTRTPEQYRSKLASFGAKVDVDHIITSSMALASILEKEHPKGGKIYVIGEQGLVDAMQAKGFLSSDEGVVAVVAGMDRHLTFPKLERAALLIRAGVPFYGTNPDKTFPTPRGLVPGAGAILALLETATGVEPIIAGKPQRYMFDLALNRMNVSAAETVSVGDRLETDIVGGIQAGCKTALVLTGVTSKEILASSNLQPDMVVDKLADLLQ
jgi:4-nitrophenyl phosphatase